VHGIPELDIYYPGAVLPTDQDIYQTIIDTLGITEQEYYTKVTSDPSSCFDIEQ